MLENFQVQETVQDDKSPKFKGTETPKHQPEHTYYSFLICRTSSLHNNTIHSPLFLPFLPYHTSESTPTTDSLSVAHLLHTTIPSIRPPLSCPFFPTTPLPPSPNFQIPIDQNVETQYFDVSRVCYKSLYNEGSRRWR